MRVLPLGLLGAPLLVLSMSAASPRTPAEVEHEAVTIEMRRVHLRVADRIALDVSYLKGRLISRSAAPPVFDDGNSYTLALDLAELSIDEPSLNALVVSALNRARSSLSDVRVSVDGPLLKQSGKLRSGIDVPFSVRSRVDATPDGRVRLRPVSVKAIGMPVAGFMKAIGLELDELLEVAPGRGVEVRDNDILLAPGQVLPPPEISGPLTSVTVRGRRLVQVFGSRAELDRARRARHPSGNYVQFSGNRIRFGRLTMADTDMRLIDADPKDPFDFYPARYVAQLVAGYSKNTPRGALRVYMPDHDDVSRRGEPSSAPLGARRLVARRPVVSAFRRTGRGSGPEP